MPRGRAALFSFVPLLVLGMLLVALSGCPGSRTTRCGELVCQEGLECDEIHELCVLPSQLIVCVGLPNGSPCYVAGQPHYVCDQEVCVPSRCGDAILDLNEGEECDDGDGENSDSDPDACRLDCREAWCGDGVTDNGEECDDANLVDSDGCRNDCTIAACGNGLPDPGEQCDDGGESFDCNDDCTEARCGDGILNATRGEGCDGTDLGGRGCADLGFAGGTMTCDQACNLVLTACTGGCGNDLLEVDEECDGADLGGERCEYQGFASGSLACRPGCTFDYSQCVDGCGNGVRELAELCDGADLDGRACSDLGFAGGTLACRGDCSFRLDQCTGGCGNGVLEGVEECDSGNLDGKSCSSLGFSGGTLVCSASCSLDLTACTGGCGNGIREGTEDCDGADLGGGDCVYLGFLSGTMGCQASCLFDFTQCVGGCGNGVRELAEECDVQDFGADTCQTYGFTGGALSCRANCTRYYTQCVGCGNGTLETGEQCDDGNFTDWDGCTDCRLEEFRVNTNTSASKGNPSVAMASDSSFVVSWQSTQDPGPNLGIYFQRYDDQGSRDGGELRANTYTSGTQNLSSVSMADDGRFVVVWQDGAQDGSNSGIYGQRFDSFGSTVGSEFRANTTTNLIQRVPSVSMTPGGSFVVTWDGQTASDTGGIAGQRYDATGATLGAEFQANANSNFTQSNAAVGMADDGSFVISWSSANSAGTYDVYSRRYLPSGSPAAAQFLVNTTTTNNQADSSCAMSADGRFVVVWRGEGPGDTLGVFFQRYDASGAAVGVETRANTYTTGQQQEPVVAVADDGSFVTVWRGEGVGDTQGIFLQRFDNTGAQSGAEYRVNTVVSGTQSGPAVAMAGDGRFVVVWQAATFTDIHAQRFDAAGNPLGAGP